MCKKGTNHVKKRTYNDNKLTGKGWFDFPDWIQFV